MAESCKHSIIGAGLPRELGRCEACGASVEMECLSYNKPCGCLKHVFWQKSDPRERTQAHPANRPDCVELAPGWWAVVPATELLGSSVRVA